MPWKIRTLLTVGTACLALGALSASPALAAARKKPRTKDTHEAVYRCKDANGQSHFGQSIPAVCIGRDIEVLDNTGRVVRRIDNSAVLALRAEQQELEAARKKAAELAAQRDRTLLATYLTVTDIERLRDNRLEILVLQSQVTREYIANLRERENRLVQDVQRFRPYSGKANAPAVPDHLAEEMVNTVNGLQVYQEELAKNTSEQTRLREEFDRDIARFKELKGLN
ncbi:MAG TPA: DUF4124 domain-containing protein [Burkholderiales bacterium]|nr:DUF4124 domain-containing protein [Burkholderiales bacterium]